MYADIKQMLMFFKTVAAQFNPLPMHNLANPVQLKSGVSTCS